MNSFTRTETNPYELTVTGVEGGIVREFGIDIYTLLYLK